MDDARNTSNQDQQPDLELGNATNTNEGSSQVFQIPESELELTPAASHSHSKPEEQLLIPPQSTPKLTDAFPIKVDQDTTRSNYTPAKKTNEMQKSLHSFISEWRQWKRPQSRYRQMCGTCGVRSSSLKCQ